MPTIFKYFFGLYCIIALAGTRAGAQEMLFDPIDVLTGHAVIEQYHHHGGQHLNSSSDHKKNNFSSSDHRHNKKYNNGRHISLDLYFDFENNSRVFIPSEAIALTPLISPHYRYLFYREINPPPPKSC
ncbi:MAG: hypothetical protein BGO69_08275 [Bacteroidetes bacterium 46-16]|nr:MAG: hypothetical protein BGO69_08275 [Bacteroidetes bacterium 46-16]